MSISSLSNTALLPPVARHYLTSEFGYIPLQDQCELEATRIVNAAAVHGENAVLDLFKSVMLRKEYYEVTGEVVVSQLLAAKLFYLADLYIQEGNVNVFLHRKICEIVPRTLLKQWARLGNSFSELLVYAVEKRDEKVFAITLEKYKEAPREQFTFRSDTLSLNDAIICALETHQMEKLKLLLQYNREELTSYPFIACGKGMTEEEALEVLKHISKPDANVAINLAKAGQKRALELFLAEHPNIKINFEDCCWIKEEEFHLILLPHMKLDEKALFFYTYHKYYRVIDYILQKDLKFKNADDTKYESAYKSYTFWMGENKVAVYVLQRYPQYAPIALPFLLIKNNLQGLSLALKLHPKMEITSDHFQSARSDEAVQLLFQQSNIISFDDASIESMISNKLTTTLESVFKKYPNKAKEVKFLHKALTSDRNPIVAMLLQKGAIVDEISLQSACRRDEGTFQLVCDAVRKSNPALFDKITLCQMPLECSDQLFAQTLHLFGSVDGDALWNSLIKSHYDQILGKCLYLHENGYPCSPKHVKAAASERKDKIFFWLMDHVSEPVVLDWLPYSKEIQKGLIPYIESGKLSFLESNVLDCEIPITIMQALFKPYEGHLGFAASLQKFLPFILKLFRAGRDGFCQSIAKPIEYIAKIIIEANSKGVCPKRYVCQKIESSVKSIVDRDKIWKLQVEDLPSIHVGKLSSFRNKCNPLKFNETLYLELYEKLSAICNRREEADSELPLYACMLLELFGSVDKALAYIEDFEKHTPNTNQLLHDACLFELPTHESWDSELWSDIVSKHKYSREFMNLLPYAGVIESVVNGPLPSWKQVLQECSLDGDRQEQFRKIYMKYLIKIELDEWPIAVRSMKKAERRVLVWKYCEKHLKVDMRAFIDKKAKHAFERKDKDSLPSLEETRKVIEEKVKETCPVPELLQFLIERRNIAQYSGEDFFKIVFENIYQNIDETLIPIAKLCIANGVKKVDFDKICELLKHPKFYEALPDIHVILAEYPGCVLRKLHKKDLRAAIIGHLTHCCQSIGRQGEKPAIHAIKSLFGALYVLINEKKDMVIAQAWAGITKDKENNSECVFDSIESNKRFSPQMISRFYTAAAEAILKSAGSLRRVCVGGGGATPRSFAALPLLPQPYAKILGYPDVGYDSSRFRYIVAQTQITRASNLSAFVETHGTDTYVKPGESVRTLAMNALERQLFWKEHPKAQMLLRGNSLNPLLEEGYVSKENRDGEGELFLNDLALNILTTHLFQSTSVIFLANQPEKLVKQLRPLSRGESLSIGYVEKIHASAAYVQNVDGSMKAFIVDSEGRPAARSPLVEGLCMAYPGIKIIYNNVCLQGDFYSCGIFMIKALRFFAKEGHTLFAKIDQPAFLKEKQGIFRLAEERTPPVLLKMAQCGIEISGIEGCIVSRKAQLTLQAYRERYAATFNGRQYSVAALRCNYRHFDKLEQLIHQ